MPRWAESRLMMSRFFFFFFLHNANLSPHFSGSFLLQSLFCSGDAYEWTLMDPEHHIWPRACVCARGRWKHPDMVDHTSSPKARSELGNTRRSILLRLIDGWNGGKHSRLPRAHTRAHTVITSVWFVLKCHFCLDCSYFKPSEASHFYLEMDVLGKYFCEDSRSRDQMVHFYFFEHLLGIWKFLRFSSFVISKKITNSNASIEARKDILKEKFFLLIYPSEALGTNVKFEKKIHELNPITVTRFLQIWEILCYSSDIKLKNKTTKWNVPLRSEKQYEKKNDFRWFIHQKSWVKNPVERLRKENSWFKLN